MKIDEKCTEKEYNALFHAVESCRKNAECVKVSRSALRHLLEDHQALWTALGGKQK